MVLIRRRGIFVTVQNPFGKYVAGPAASPYAPPPPPAGPCPANAMAGKNHRGDDLVPGGIRGLSVAGCQAACTERADCAGFVYLPTGCDVQPSNDCYLKSNITASSALPCACTVAKPFGPSSPWQVHPGAACNNPDRPMFNAQTASARECQQLCAANASCVECHLRHDKVRVAGRSPALTEIGMRLICTD